MKIKFANTNTASSPTLNINSTGAKAILYNGAVASSTNSWDSGEVVVFYFDPSYNNNEGAFIGFPLRDKFTQYIELNASAQEVNSYINL